MTISGDRRRFPRVLADVYHRPAGPAFLHHRRASRDVSLGGMRVQTDELLAIGTALEIDLLLDGDCVVTCWARVAWIDQLEGGGPAAYDVGLEFTDMADEDRARLNRVLEGRQT